MQCLLSPAPALSGAQGRSGDEAGREAGKDMSGEGDSDGMEPARALATPVPLPMSMDFTIWVPHVGGIMQTHLPCLAY